MGVEIMLISNIKYVNIPLYQCIDNNKYGLWSNRIQKILKQQINLRKFLLFFSKYHSGKKKSYFIFPNGDNNNIDYFPWL